jgi:4-diphosphocytidyl-2-C-methyl-D-erythritol kinase
MSRTSDSTRFSPQRRVSVRCPAKINLHLRVAPARSDGFHPLLTWMCTVGLFDMLEMRLGDSAAHASAADATTSRISLRCDDANLPVDERNLVVRIVDGWAKENGGTALSMIDASLSKRTPRGAGLGGGSSDAACALLAALKLWGVASEPVVAKDLSAFAARFGSDIPFFFAAPSAVCTGRGEIVQPVSAPAAKAALLVLPPIVMPTPAVYRKFDEMNLGRSRVVEEEPDWQKWAKLPAAELMRELVNDLEPPAMALRPDLEQLRRRIETIVGRTVRMSGSGSSLFTLFDTMTEAESAKERVREELKNETTRLEAVEVGPPIVVE